MNKTIVFGLVAMLHASYCVSSPGPRQGSVSPSTLVVIYNLTLAPLVTLLSVLINLNNIRLQALKPDTDPLRAVAFGSQNLCGEIISISIIP